MLASAAAAEVAYKVRAQVGVAGGRSILDANIIGNARNAPAGLRQRVAVAPRVAWT